MKNYDGRVNDYGCMAMVVFILVGSVACIFAVIAFISYLVGLIF